MRNRLAIEKMLKAIGLSITSYDEGIEKIPLRELEKVAGYIGHDWEEIDVTICREAYVVIVEYDSADVSLSMLTRIEYNKLNFIVDKQ